MISLRMAVYLTDVQYKDVLSAALPQLSSLMLVVTHYGGPHSDQPAEGKKIAVSII